MCWKNKIKFDELVVNLFVWYSMFNDRNWTVENVGCTYRLQIMNTYIQCKNGNFVLLVRINSTNNNNNTSSNTHVLLINIKYRIKINIAVQLYNINLNEQKEDKNKERKREKEKKKERKREEKIICIYMWTKPIQSYMRYARKTRTRGKKCKKYKWDSN